jgi:hypothetical protein
MLDLHFEVGFPNLVIGGKLRVWKGVFLLLIGMWTHHTYYKTSPEGSILV